MSARACHEAQLYMHADAEVDIHTALFVLTTGAFSLYLYHHERGWRGLHTQQPEAHMERRKQDSP